MEGFLTLNENTFSNFLFFLFFWDKQQKTSNQKEINLINDISTNKKNTYPYCSYMSRRNTIFTRKLY